MTEAAEWAPSGAALWLEGGDPSLAPPDGFAWTQAGTDDLRRLPSGSYRFVVAGTDDTDPRDLARLLDEGGVAVARLATDELPRLDDAQVIDVRHDGSMSMLAFRRVR